jgi:putative transposase
MEGEVFWGKGYFVVTVGDMNEETITEYIRQQEENDRLVDDR